MVHCFREWPIYKSISLCNPIACSHRKQMVDGRCAYLHPSSSTKGFSSVLAGPTPVSCLCFHCRWLALWFHTLLQPENTHTHTHTHTILFWDCWICLDIPILTCMILHFDGAAHCSSITDKPSRDNMMYRIITGAGYTCMYNFLIQFRWILLLAPDAFNKPELQLKSEDPYVWYTSPDELLQTTLAMILPNPKL